MRCPAQHLQRVCMYLLSGVLISADTGELLRLNRRDISARRGLPWFKRHETNRWLRGV